MAPLSGSDFLSATTGTSAWRLQGKLRPVCPKLPVPSLHTQTSTQGLSSRDSVPHCCLPPWHWRYTLHSTAHIRCVCLLVGHRVTSTSGAGVGLWGRGFPYFLASPEPGGLVSPPPELICSKENKEFHHIQTITCLYLQLTFLLSAPYMPGPTLCLFYIYLWCGTWFPHKAWTLWFTWLKQRFMVYP